MSATGRDRLIGHVAASAGLRRRQLPIGATSGRTAEASHGTVHDNISNGTLIELSDAELDSVGGGRISWYRPPSPSPWD